MTIKQQGGIFGRNPTFNNLTADGYAVFGGDASFLNTSGSVKGFWNSTTSRFGLGTISPLGILQLREGNPDLYITSDDTGQTDIFFGGASAPTTGNIKYSDNDKSLRLTANSTEALRLESTGNVNVKAGNLVIGTSGKGIDFSATSGTGTSELFDDYEEGTWTPVIADAATGGNTGTAGDLAGFYTKVGRLVTVLVRIVNTDTVGMTPLNTLYVRGLPFAATATGNGHLYTGSVRTADVTLTGHTLVAEIGGSGADYIRFSESQSGSAATFLTVGDLTLYQSDIFFSLTYAV